MAKISSNDYESCNITFDDKGNAKVTIVGKGKFEGMAVCNANKNSASISNDCSTNAKYFSYEVLEEKTYNVEVENIDKCKTYVLNDGTISEEQATALCNDGSITIGEQTFSLKSIVSSGMPSSECEVTGLKVEIIDSISIIAYNIAGGTDVVIPSQIDGKKVVAIADYAFTTDYVIPTLTAYNNDYKVSLLSYNSNNNYVIKQLAETNYGGVGINSVIIPNTVTSIGTSAFYGNNLTNVTIPSSVTTIEGNAFKNNPNIVITNNSGIENTVDVWRRIVCVSSDAVIINNNVISVKSN